MKIVAEQTFDNQGMCFQHRLLVRIHRKVYDNGKIVDRYNVGIGNSICNVKDLEDLLGDEQAWHFLNSAKLVASRTYA